MRNNKLFKSVLSLVLVVAMVLGTVTTSYAEEVETTEVTVEDVFEAIENVEEKVDDVIASLPYGGDLSGAVEDVVITVAGEEKIVGVVEEAEEVIENEALLDSEETDAAASEMNTAEEKIEEIEDAVADMEETYGEADEMEFDTIEDAEAAVNELTKAEEDAKAAYAEAETALEAAKGNLDEAQAEYEAAKAISEEAAAEAAAKVEAAKATLAELEKVANEANDRVKETQDLLNKVADKVSDAENKSDVALEEAQNKLEESKETLDSAIENVETESAEFNAAIDDFKVKYDAFVESANNFYEAVQKVGTTQEELDRLYADYEAAQAALEAAKAAYAEEQKKCEELGYKFEEDYFTNFEKYISDLETAMNTAEGLKNAAEEEKNKAEEAKEAYETEEAKAYETALNGYRDTLKSEEATQEDKDAAAKEAAKLVIEKELAKGQNVTWIPAGESEYGKSATGFYVVLDAEGNLVERYGYVVESSSVDIYQMKSDEVVNYVTYNNVPYPITKAEDGTLTINVNGKPVTVTKEVGEDNKVAYYVKDAAKTEVVKDTTKAPVLSEIDISFLGNGINVPGGSMKVEGADKYSVTATLSYTIPFVGTSTNEIVVVIEKGADGKWYLKYDEKGINYEISESLISFPKKTQIVYGDGMYDIVTEGNTKYILVNGERVTVYEDDGVYTTRNNTTYIPGGTADTTFEIGAATNKNSNTYEGRKNAAETTYNEKLGIYNGKVTEYNNAVNSFNTSNEVFGALAEAHQNMSTADKNAEDKDLGSLANLPKDFTELFEVIDVESVEDITAIGTAIGKLTSEDANAFEKLDAAAEVLDGLNLGATGIKASELVAAIVSSDSYKHEYLMAWIDAVTAKVNVVVAAVEVVEATSETITAGLTVINTGADLGDAAIDALLAKVEETILNGSVETLAVVADILDVSDRIVTALSDKMNALVAETQEAYDAVVKAQEALDALELNVKAEELVKAEQVLADATARYEALVEELEATKADLATAESYKNAAQAQYDALTAPAAGEEGPEGLPTPGVDAPVEEEEEVVTPVTPVVPSTPSIEEVIEATTVATTTTIATITEEVEIEDEETPLAGGDVEDEVVIEDEETPLANGEEVEIEDEEIPLAAEDTTSNMVVPVAVTAGGVSILAVVVLLFLKKRKAA